MTEDQIKYMVDRFLAWKLPEGFNPDGGISFKATFNEHTAHPMKHEPSGTNLFDASQATVMVRHMIDGAPPAVIDIERLRAALSEMIDAYEGEIQWCSGCENCSAKEKKIADARCLLALTAGDCK